MQDNPKKLFTNYNEYTGNVARLYMDRAKLDANANGIEFQEVSDHQDELITSTFQEVDKKVEQILGRNNSLQELGLIQPKIKLLKTFPEKQWSGFFSSKDNSISIVMDTIHDDMMLQKVTAHEYFHFLSHNGFDESENLSEAAPLKKRNNVGFRRNGGLDIRSGSDGKLTYDYFASFNEAVTEQLAIDVFPDCRFKAYREYREMLDQVFNDAEALSLGSVDSNGKHRPWTKEEIKNYVYRQYFKGDLDGLTTLLKTTYSEFNISEQQFGLMTCKDDLPSIVQQKYAISNGGGNPPSPGYIQNIISQRINAKTHDNYVTDIDIDIPKDKKNEQKQSIVLGQQSARMTIGLEGGFMARASRPRSQIQEKSKTQE